MAGWRRVIWPLTLVVVGCIAGFTAQMGATPQNAQQVDAKFFQDLRWRSIGPPRAGRVVAVAGVRSEPETYYFWRSRRRCLENQRCRPNLESHFRFAAGCLHRRNRRRSFKSANYLRRLRRS